MSMKHTTSAIAGNAKRTPDNWRRRLSVSRRTLGANVGRSVVGMVVLMVKRSSFDSFSSQNRVPTQPAKDG
jgi:hypothetical protein